MLPFSAFAPQTVRRCLLLPAAMLLTCALASAASFLNVANGVWSTGFNVAGSLLPQTGVNVDGNYRLQQVPTGCAGVQCTTDGSTPFGNGAFVVENPGGQFPFNVWLNNNANSQWIGPRANQTNPNVNGTTFPNVGVFGSSTSPYVYRLAFNLSALGLDPTTANIQLAWLADNSDNAGNPLLSSHIRLCAISSLGDPLCPGGIVPNSGNAGPAGTSLTPVSIVHNGTSVVFSSGWMALDFVVYNSPIAFGNNPSGMRVQMLSADAQPDSTIPEPATLALVSAALITLGALRKRRV